MPAGLGQAGMVRVDEQDGTGASPTISLVIPGGYRDLIVRVTGRSDAAGTGGAGVIVTFESSPTVGAYDHERLIAQATSVSAAENIGTQDSISAGLVPTDGAAANLHGFSQFLIPEYSVTNKMKMVFNFGVATADLTSNNVQLRNSAGVWESTAAITLVRLTLGAGNWKTTSRATAWCVV